jgi:hypothetical protein
MQKLMVGIPVAALLMQQLYWGGSRLLAEFWAFPAVAKLEWWDEWDIDPGEAEWRPMQQRVERALAYMPDDPELLAVQGDLYTQRLSDDVLSEAEVREAVVLGSRAYLGSLRQRPTWVRDWDDLALIKYNQEQYRDPDYQLALRQMTRFGAQRGGLMTLLYDMAIESWPELDETTRATLLERTNLAQVREQRAATAVAGAEF